MTETRPAWEERGYGDVSAATRLDGNLEVEFGNGESVVLPASLFGVVGQFAARPDDDGLGVVLTSVAGEVVVGWSQLRAAADANFAQELRRRDADEARRIGLRLRALREDRNLSQRDVANRAGMSAPQLSKIETGSSDLRLSTLQSLLRVIGASLADITGPDAPEVSRRGIERRAVKAGAPRDVVRDILEVAPRGAVGDVFLRAFGWSLRDLVSERIAVPPLPMAVAFKSVRPGNDPLGSPIVQLAQTIADIARATVPKVQFRGIPGGGSAINRAARDSHGRVTLDSLSRWAWQAGVPVVPLRGKGGFAASIWNSRQPPVIVLNESRELAVFWLFDLAHELAHLALGHVDNRGLIDVESPSSMRGEDAIERAADQFALETLLPSHQELIVRVRLEARGSHLRFKNAVAAVARAANVSPGLLGVIAAYEMTEVGEYKDRWGSATNLARSEGTGREPVEKVAREFMNANDLNSTDAVLLKNLVLSGG